MGILLSLGLLAIPLGHQVHSHQLLRKLRPGRPEPTAHERAHAARPRTQRMAADTAWLFFIALAVVVGIVAA